MSVAKMMRWGPCQECDGKCGGYKGSDGLTNLWVYGDASRGRPFGLFRTHGAEGLIDRFTSREAAYDHAQTMATTVRAQDHAAIPRETESIL